MAPPTTAVVAHTKKTLGGGLDELRGQLRRAGLNPDWYEVPKSRKAPGKVRKALKNGAELIFVWGGDGMVQRCADAIAGSSAGSRVAMAVLPAGTANLFADNLGLRRGRRRDLREHRRRLDLGKVNGEHFAVMAGAGFDGELIRGADRGLKDRVGRLAYLWTGLRQVGHPPVPATIRVDGDEWFDGHASCVLLGNVGTIGGGIPAFVDASPDDGWLEVGVATAHGAVQWARTLGRMAAGQAERSPFVQTTRARRVQVDLGAPMTYELDGGVRDRTTRLDAKVVPGAITVCVPWPG